MDVSKHRVLIRQFHPKRYFAANYITIYLTNSYLYF